MPPEIQQDRSHEHPFDKIYRLAAANDVMGLTTLLNSGTVLVDCFRDHKFVAPVTKLAFDGKTAAVDLLIDQFDASPIHAVEGYALAGNATEVDKFTLKYKGKYPNTVLILAIAKYYAKGGNFELVNKLVEETFPQTEVIIFRQPEFRYSLPCTICINAFQEYLLADFTDESKRMKKFILDNFSHVDDDSHRDITRAIRESEEDYKCIRDLNTLITSNPDILQTGSASVITAMMDMVISIGKDDEIDALMQQFGRNVVGMAIYFYANRYQVERVEALLNDASNVPDEIRKTIMLIACKGYAHGGYINRLNELYSHITIPNIRHRADWEQFLANAFMPDDYYQNTPAKLRLLSFINKKSLREAIFIRVNEFEDESSRLITMNEPVILKKAAWINAVMRGAQVDYDVALAYLNLDPSEKIFFTSVNAKFKISDSPSVEVEITPDIRAALMSAASNSKLDQFNAERIAKGIKKIAGYLPQNKTIRFLFKTENPEQPSKQNSKPNPRGK